MNNKWVLLVDSSFAEGFSPYLHILDIFKREEHGSDVNLAHVNLHPISLRSGSPLLLFLTQLRRCRNDLLWFGTLPHWRGQGLKPILVSDKGRCSSIGELRRGNGSDFTEKAYITFIVVMHTVFNRLCDLLFLPALILLSHVCLLFIEKWIKFNLYFKRANEINWESYERK